MQIAHDLTHWSFAVVPVHTCIGLHNFCPQAFGIQHSFNLVVDRSQRAQAFILGNHGPRVQHLIGEVEHHLQGSAHCLVCRRVHKIDSTNIDVRVWSPPCQPFSAMRFKKGSTKSTGAPCQHPGYGVASQLLPELEERMPARIVLIEEVMAFLKPDDSGVSPAELVVADLELVYGQGCVAVMTVDSAIWMEGSRPRFHFNKHSNQPAA